MTAWRVFVCVFAFVLSAAGVPRESRTPQGDDPRVFRVVDVFVDAGDERLAAWQLEFVDPTVALVGIEGGDGAAFRDPPRYDPAALSGGRVILAALAAGDDLPNGRVRVAQLHVMASRDAVLDPTVRSVAAARGDGARIDVRVSVEPRGRNR